MDACSTFIAATALTLSAMVASADAATVTFDMPEWMKGSLFLVITALLIWLIIQGWGRYDKLLARIDKTDEKRLEVEVERLKVERERIVTDERQTTQITTLARVIERLEGAIIENTKTVHKCPLEKEHHT
jgi:K+ transporter